MSERITLIEIDIKRCSLTYGQGACTASGEPCYNSFGTCQAKLAFTEEIVVACYSTPTNNPDPESDCLPSLVSVSERPAMLALGESIGTRASVTATFADHPYPDTGPEGDRYRDQRSYDPMTTGTYWGKFRARYPFMQGWSARLLQGTTNQQRSAMETRHFIIDTFAGPDSSGSVTLVLKDALKMADGKKAQAPRVSIGELAANITAGDTSFTITPVGAGDEYPSYGLLAIGGDEIVTYASRSGDTFTGVQRGQLNTAPQEHSAGARVQIVTQYLSQPVTDILADLLINYAGVPAAYIPSAEWALEASTYIQRNYTAYIADPTPVNDLINELLEQTASTLWWDDYARLIRFRVLRAVESDAATYDDDVIKANSFSSADQNDKRVSQVWTYYGQINPLESQDDPSNYSRSVVTVSPESEQNFGGTPSIKRVFSRWITETGSDAAQRLNLLILSRYTTPPRLLSWTLQRNPALVVPQLGAGYRLASWTLQKPSGELDVIPAQVVQIKTTEAEHRVTAEEVLYSETVAPEDPNIKNITIDSSRLNLNLYDAALASNFSAPAAGDEWIFTVAEGVVIGSNSTGAGGVDTGSGWPAGVTIRLVILPGAYVVGRGGDGGNSSAFADDMSVVGAGTTATSTPGKNGGPALRAQVPIEIDNQGVIGGGGGGGGGASAAVVIYRTNPTYAFFGVASSSSGAGGAGNISGVGGFADATVSSSTGRHDISVVNGGPANLTAGGVAESVTASEPLIPSYTVSATAKGGNGGGLGQPGASGASSYNDNREPYMGSVAKNSAAAGGAPGAAVVGNANITWINTGTRLGAIT